MGPSVSTSWSSDVRVDASLGTDIDENVSVEEALAKCKAQGYTRGHAHLDSSLDPAFVAHCDRMQYMEVILQQGNNTHDPAWTASTKSVRIWPHTATDAPESTDATFQSFFQKHVLQAQPAEASDILSFPPALLNTCFDIMLESSTLNIHSPPCQDLLASFHVPACVANDYMQRINTSHAITLPTLLKFTSATATHCRYGLNMALVAVDNSGLSVSVSTRAPSLNEYTLPLHIGMTEEASSPSTASTPALQLGQGRVVFVPNGYAAVFQGTAVRFCFTDASNFNRMKQHLRVEALLDPAARAWLLAFQDTTFDSSMIRRVTATHTNWPSFRQWPKPQKLTKESQGDAAQSRRERYKIWQDDRKWDSLITGLTLPVTRPPLLLDATKDVHRTSLTLTWQDAYQPRKGDITPYGYEVSWVVADATSAPPSPLDHSTATVHKRNLSSSELVRSELPTTAFGDDFDGKAIQGTITGLDPNTTYTFTLRLFVGDDIGLHSERSSSMRTAPISVPTAVRGQPTVANPADSNDVRNCASLSWLPPADDGGSEIVGYVISGRYDPAQSTNQVDVDATAAAVVWQPFNDTSQFDMVQSVVVTMRELTTDARNVSGTACNLRQRETYQFQVAALNAVGIGAFSMWSRPLQIPATRARQDLVRGAGAAADGPVMLLSDKQQLFQPYQRIAPSLATAALRYDAKNNLIWSSWFAHVWPGHFSPKTYSVVAEIVAASPVLADRPLENDVRDRIALVRRGKLPLFNKVLHAQNAGALAVVIVDADGLCDDDSGTVGTFDHHCSVGSNHAFGEGFGAQDDAAVWSAIRIPHVLLLRGDAAALLARLSTAQAQSFLT
ncbi:hypothetical protein DYB32_000136 [Aphanomyces invadans]|uniref:Fibronectin type-III domain-containing protein n=1 Tax=Aphanomyces invadans TaxID=157072 RepID=A0A3R6ZBG1_9STRA|nr:hypothetical protein DYB32_000136 [Aphanomyces invadans]